MRYQNMAEAAIWQLLYDGGCETCISFAKLIERFDKGNHVSVESLQNFYASDQTYPLEDLLSELHIIGPKGEVKCGGEALAEIIRLVPQMKPFRWMVETRWGKKTMETVYHTMHRSRRCRSCR
jgi:predicted DCC family thiol-disulfide oxidoreductase YuxK